jgi:hypothetical protein
MQLIAVISKALRWRIDHREHVERLEASTTSVFAPSKEDASHPELWKAASWRWLRGLEMQMKEKANVGEG